jgi:hypothetical protein
VSLLSDQESDVARVVDVLHQKVAAVGAPTVVQESDAQKAARARADLRWIVAAVAAFFLAFDALWLTKRGKRIVARLQRRSA